MEHVSRLRLVGESARHNYCQCLMRAIAANMIVSVCLLVTTVCLENENEPIEMPSGGRQTHVDPRNRVFYGLWGPDCLP